MKSETHELKHMMKNYGICVLITLFVCAFVFNIPLRLQRSEIHLTTLTSPLFWTTFGAIGFHLLATYLYRLKRENGETETLKDAVRYAIIINGISLLMIVIQTCFFFLSLDDRHFFLFLSVLIGGTPLLIYTACALVCTIRYAIRASMRIKNT